MKLPRLENSKKYVGLYVFDFGEQAGVGFTAQEVAELLESEKYRNCKVYKIHRARPDGQIELKGVSNGTFGLEAGMFFYSTELGKARENFQNLVQLAEKSAPPCRAKVHLVKYNDVKYALALIYPAEYDDEISSWLLEADYKAEGAAEGGVGAVQRYYERKPQILQREQLFGQSSYRSRTGEELFKDLKKVVQR
jgi:hypothetical protein